MPSFAGRLVESWVYTDIKNIFNVNQKFTLVLPLKDHHGSGISLEILGNSSYLSVVFVLILRV